METMKFIVCCALIVIIASDAIFARPRSSAQSNSEMEALVKDIDNRLIHSEKVKNRRRRRHVMTYNLALMEFCLQKQHRCRQEIERLRRLNASRRRPVYSVVVIEK